MNLNTDSAGDSPYPVIDFSPMDQAWHDDYRNVNMTLSARCPVAWTTSEWSATAPPGQWILNSQREAMTALTEWKTFTSEEGVSPIQWPLDVVRLIPVETDPPVHREIRKALNPFFAPAALAENDDGLQEIIDSLFENALQQGDGTVDFIAEVSSKLPPTVLLGPGLLNVGVQHRESLLGLIGELLENPERTAEIAPKLFVWSGEVLEASRAAGNRTDLVGTIAHLGIDDPALQMSEKERVETLTFIVLAGMETTTGALGTIAWLLGTKPELRAQLRDLDDRMMSRAVEELVRWVTPTPTGARTLTEDVELRGCPMKKGDRILINFGAANRDAEQFPDPDEIDFNRPNVTAHVAFGGGIHRCLGSHLAKRELTGAIRAICALSEFRVDPDWKLEVPAALARKPARLPVVMAR